MSQTSWKQLSPHPSHQQGMRLAAARGWHVEGHHGVPTGKRRRNLQKHSKMWAESPVVASQPWVQEVSSRAETPRRERWRLGWAAESHGICKAYFDLMDLCVWKLNQENSCICHRAEHKPNAQDLEAEELSRWAECNFVLRTKIMIKITSIGERELWVQHTNVKLQILSAEPQ